MGKKAAFCGIKELHKGEGDPKVLEYVPFFKADDFDGTIFTAPKKGIYAFYISFMRDATKQMNGEQGFGDDCHIEIWVNDEPRHGAYVYVGENSLPRDTASTQFLLDLEEDDRVTTHDWMDEGKKRIYRHCVFTGYRVAKT